MYTIYIYINREVGIPFFHIRNPKKSTQRSQKANYKRGNKSAPELGPKVEFWGSQLLVIPSVTS